MLNRPLNKSQFHVFLPWVDVRLAFCLNSVLNVKAIVGPFNQERGPVRVFSGIVETNGSFAALTITPALPAYERRAVLEVVLQQAHGDVLVQGVLVLPPRAAGLELKTIL